MKHAKNSSTSARAMLIAVVIFILVMASQSMNAADTTDKPVFMANNIHTTTYNQFSTSSHFRNW